MWLRKALKYIEPHKLQTDTFSWIIQLFSLAIVKIVFQQDTVLSVFCLVPMYNMQAQGFHHFPPGCDLGGWNLHLTWFFLLLCWHFHYSTEYLLFSSLFPLCASTPERGVWALSHTPSFPDGSNDIRTDVVLIMVVMLRWLWLPYLSCAMLRSTQPGPKR